ncbi:MAG: bifunctional glutamate N-acetyltransferase/amino-acid acetyltransferase ArgJ [Desulfovibrionaceae bacterium]|nr:bifunctional glutamate N-acetyltransferase/amino-acid acetyltransferase ArgJ [Desulfovibrionaceae bacterium]
MQTNDLPKGFSAGAAQAGFKTKGRDDLGLIVSDTEAVAAGVFTTNVFKAAPVLVCQEVLKKHATARAIVANSGQANACTGEEGLKNCHETQKMVAERLGIEPDTVLTLSTGVIGDQLKMDKWLAAVPELVASLGTRDAEGFTRAFMTTDAFPKFASRDIQLSGGTVRLTTMAKGAGMICPNMATMLCVCLTDAEVDPAEWQALFARCADRTFNRVSVDGDTSTNDTILALANGASGVSITDPADAALFEQELTEILRTTAHMLVKDGEGATKVMHIHVTGADSDRDAEQVARTVGHSQLVKTAIYGRDANWGRIVAAVGRSGVKMKAEDVSVSLCGVDLFRNGQPLAGNFDAQLEEPLKEENIPMEISIGVGPGSYLLEASDLSVGYVKLNSDYRS